MSFSTTSALPARVSPTYIGQTDRQTSQVYQPSQAGQTSTQSACAADAKPAEGHTSGLSFSGAMAPHSEIKTTEEVVPLSDSTQGVTLARRPPRLLAVESAQNLNQPSPTGTSMCADTSSSSRSRSSSSKPTTGAGAAIKKQKNQPSNKLIIAAWVAGASLSFLGIALLCLTGFGVPIAVGFVALGLGCSVLFFIAMPLLCGHASAQNQEWEEQRSYERALRYHRDICGRTPDWRTPPPTPTIIHDYRVKHGFV